MKLYLYIDRINLINKLIGNAKTGSQTELANRLNISVSRLARIIEYMKEQGAPIKFDRTNNTYYYEEKYFIHIHVEIVKTNGRELNKISYKENNSTKKCLNAFFIH